MQVFFVLPLNTQRWLIIRQVSDFILHLHKRGWRQPGISAGPKSSFLSPFHGKAKYQLYRQAVRRKPREQRNMTIWILISCHFHNVLTLQKKKNLGEVFSLSSSPLFSPFCQIGSFVRFMQEYVCPAQLQSIVHHGHLCT